MRPLPLGPNYFIFMQFSGNFLNQIIGCRPHLGVCRPLLWESWVRHCWRIYRGTPPQKIIEANFSRFYRRFEKLYEIVYCPPPLKIGPLFFFDFMQLRVSPSLPTGLILGKNIYMICVFVSLGKGRGKCPKYWKSQGIS